MYSEYTSWELYRTANWSYRRTMNVKDAKASTETTQDEEDNNNNGDDNNNGSNNNDNDTDSTYSHITSEEEYNQELFRLSRTHADLTCDENLRRLCAKTDNQGNRGI